MMTQEAILAKLPYSKPFLFVDTIDSVNAEAISGSYYFDEELDFYKGHFTDKPITPGVILTEVMAQIGLVCLGIFLHDGAEEQANSIALTQTNIEFYKPVYPGERVTVQGKKEYFRFGKLKCQVTMRNENDDIVCDGFISGIVVKHTK